MSNSSAKAGLIPYIFEDGVLKVCVMVSSNPKFGGPLPMISKGSIEEGETTLETAIREAEEELGLKRENMLTEPKLLDFEHVVLRSGEYDLTVFAVEIADKKNFGPWSFETKFTTWMTLDSFRTKGRKDHVRYIEKLAHVLGA